MAAWSRPLIWWVRFSRIILIPQNKHNFTQRKLQFDWEHPYCKRDRVYFITWSINWYVKRIAREMTREIADVAYHWRDLCSNSLLVIFTFNISLVHLVPTGEVNTVLPILSFRCPLSYRGSRDIAWRFDTTVW